MCFDSGIAMFSTIFGKSTKTDYSPEAKRLVLFSFPHVCCNRDFAHTCIDSF